MAVIDNTFETKGTHLYFVDPDSHLAVKVTCPTAITGINGGTRDKIDTNCLDNTSSFRTYIGGFADPAEVPVPFILYDGDVGHQTLFELVESGAVINWMICLSDSTDVPTVDTDFNLVSPVARTTIAFNGFVASCTLDASDNEVVRGNMTIQRSGGATFNWPA